jgi:hypothetical protein
MSFHLRDDNSRPWWWYLDLNGEPAYLIGNICGTCETIFQRMPDAKLPLTPRQLSEALENGIEVISQEIIDTVLPLLPQGEYLAGVVEFTPRLVRAYENPSSPVIGCDADYYWMRSISQDKKEQKNEILLPMVAETQLNLKRLDEYSQSVFQGSRPTALALSIVDFRAVRGEYGEWNLAHFLLDGHHKVMAASRLGRPIRLLSFLSITQSGEEILRDEFIRGHYQIPA